MDQLSGTEKITTHGAECWFKHSFEHFGWMVLAMKHGNIDKIKTYKTSLKRLHRDIKVLKSQMASLNEAGKVYDLNILEDNLTSLIEATDRMFLDSNLLGGASKAKKTSKKASKNASNKTSKKASKKSSKSKKY
jgi:hypothetical protein